MKRIGILCIIIVFTLSLVYAQQPTPQEKAQFGQYMKQGQEALKAKQYAKAVECYKKAVKVFPKQSGPWYNMACAYALSGNKEKALEALSKAVENGFADHEHMKQDKDLDSLKNDPRFEKILKRAEELAPKDEILIPSGVKQVKNLPLMVFCHGTGGNAQDGIPLFRTFSNQEKVIVYLPCGSVRMGRRQMDMKQACNWQAGKDAARIVSKVEELIKEGKADPEKVYMTGFSAGGAMTYMIGIKKSRLFKGMVIFGSTIQEGMFTDQDIKEAAPLIPFWAFHGKQDAVIPLAKGKSAFERLKKKGFNCKWTEFKGGHRLPPDYRKAFKDALEWIDEQTKLKKSLTENTKITEKG